MKKNDEIIKQMYFDSNNNISWNFLHKDNYTSKSYENSESSVNYIKNRFGTVYTTVDEATSKSESFTITNNKDIIKTTEIFDGSKLITETAVLYEDGDWYYASGDKSKTIIMGIHNYQNNIMQNYADGEIIGEYKVIKGIQLQNDKLGGNYKHLKHIETGVSYLSINNGIISNQDTIMINGYPKCVKKIFTRCLKRKFKNIRKNSQKRFICTTIDNQNVTIVETSFTKKIFTTKVTEWDVCCRLTYESKKKFWEKNNNIVENDAPGNQRNIIDLGAAYTYSDGVHKVMWKKR